MKNKPDMFSEYNSPACYIWFDADKYFEINFYDFILSESGKISFLAKLKNNSMQAYLVLKNYFRNLCIVRA